MLDEIRMTFYARSVLEMNQSCQFDGDHVGNEELFKVVEELRDFDWDQELLGEKRNQAISVLVAHCVIFLLIAVCQWCSIKVQHPTMFIYMVFMLLPTSATSLALCINHFEMLNSDI